MTDYEVTVDGQPAVVGERWWVTWVDRAAGIARLDGGDRSLLALVEGSGGDLVVTLRGRRIPVQALTARERLLAEAEVGARGHHGPLEVKASLPGLVVAVRVEPGADVAEGEALLTIEAMKMQNEVRAPRGGRVAGLAVAAGQTVMTGQLLLRIE